MHPRSLSPPGPTLAKADRFLADLSWDKTWSEMSLLVERAVQLRLEAGAHRRARADRARGPKRPKTERRRSKKGRFQPDRGIGFASSFSADPPAVEARDPGTPASAGRSWGVDIRESDRFVSGV